VRGRRNLVAGSISDALTMGVDINALVTIGIHRVGVDNVGDTLTAIGSDAMAAVSSGGAMGGDDVPQGGVPCSEVCGALGSSDATGGGSGSFDVVTLCTGSANLDGGRPNHGKGSTGGTQSGGGDRPGINGQRSGGDDLDDGDCGNKFGGGVTESRAISALQFLRGSPPSRGGPYSNKRVQTEPTFPRTTTPNFGSDWGSRER
jgi:hypothetical protein